MDWNQIMAFPDFTKSLPSKCMESCKTWPEKPYCFLLNKWIPWQDAVFVTGNIEFRISTTYGRKTESAMHALFLPTLQLALLTKWYAYKLQQH